MATFTDVDWRNYLDAQITERQPRLDLYDRYYDGDHRLAFATSKFKEAFGELFEAFATNWCGLVVDVCAERLRPIGFRFGDEPDDDAWTVWQENSLDALSLQAHTEAIKSEVAYLLVTPGPNGPRITPELASQCFVATDPSDPLNRLAAIKKYVDSNGDMVSVVWTPDTITTWRRNGVATRLQGFGLDIPAGVADWGNGRTVENVLGRVPMIPLENSPKLGKGGRSDLRPAISLNDAANKFFTDMIHASEFTAFPQRVLTGVEIPRDPTTGEVLPAAQLKAAVSRLWAFEAPDAKVTDLAAADLGNYVQGVDLAVQHIAAQTRTPPHYLLAKLINLSGDALKAAESGLVARCRRKHTDFSDAWEEAMRLAFLWRSKRSSSTSNRADLEKSKMMNAEVIWADPENQSPIAVSQSLMNKAEIGVPWEQLVEEAGYTPQEINRMRKWRKQELDEEARRTALAAEEAAKIAQKFAPKPANPNGGNGSTKPAPTRTVKPTAKPPAPAKR